MRFPTISRVKAAVTAATGTLLRSFAPALAFALAGALILAPVDYFLAEAISGGGGQSDQNLPLAVFLSWFAAYLVMTVLYGPLMSAAAVYMSRAHAQGQRAGLYHTLNFALGRYRRVFWPHMGAWLSILIGMQALVPGILFMCQYAFVDAVACLEDERWPMGRSKRLTKGRRKTVLLFALPFILVTTPKIFIDLAALEEGLLVFTAEYTLSFLLEIWLAMGFAHLYLRRVGFGSVARWHAAGEARGLSGEDDRTLTGTIDGLDVRLERAAAAEDRWRVVLSVAHGAALPGDLMVRGEQKKKDEGALTPPRVDISGQPLEIYTTDADAARALLDGGPLGAPLAELIAARPGTHLDASRLVLVHRGPWADGLDAPIAELLEWARKIQRCAA